MKQRRGRRKQERQTPSREEPSDKRQYFIAALILLLGFATSVSILRHPLRRAKEAETSETQTEQAMFDSYIPTTYTVNFYDSDGLRIASRRIPSGQPVLPPDITREGSVLKCWSQSLYGVDRDMDVHPVFQSFEQAKNTVYADAVYADISEDFVVTVCLGGDVDCCAFSIIAAYDSDLLQLVSVTPLEENITAVNGPKAGTFTLTRSGTDMLNHPLPLAELRFVAKERGSYETNLPMQTREIYTIRNEIQSYTDSSAYDASMFLLDFGEKE